MEELTLVNDSALKTTDKLCNFEASCCAAAQFSGNYERPFIFQQNQLQLGPQFGG